ncbi:hypothetical protein ABD86_18835 [Paenibacillus alvei]|nr:hypothetical protein [Paenibacillus alvei]MBG9745902.1 hypothetical protein [Paenibacillus alvei]
MTIALILNAEYKKLVNHFKQTYLINEESFAVYEKKLLIEMEFSIYLISTRGVNNIELLVLQYQMFSCITEHVGEGRFPKLT